MSAPPTKTVDTYELVASPMTEKDIPRLHELSVAVNWPHRPADWQMVLGLGKGLVARDEIERIVGSAMWFPMGERLASIGMVITSPRLQDHGAGRWLMAHVLERTAARGKVLSATKAAYRLYLSLGFQPTATVFQHNGVVVALPSAGAGARALQDKHHEAILSLDATAYGVERRVVLERLLSVSAGTVLEQGADVVGFALCRRFGRGHVIGPVVAQTEEEAVALIAPHVAAHEGDFLRMDTRQPEGVLRDYLATAGMTLYDTVTTMTLGERPASGSVTTFGLVNQALG